MSLSNKRKKASAKGKPATTIGSRLSITPAKRAAAGMTAADVISPPSPRSSANVARTNASRSKPGNMKSATGHLGLADIPLADGAARQLQHTFKRLQRLQARVFVDLDPGSEVAQAKVQFFKRIQRHIWAHVAVAVAVRSRCADEDLVGRRLFHLVDDVRFGRNDDRLRRAGQGKSEDRRGRTDMVGMLDDIAGAFRKIGRASCRERVGKEV